MSKIKQLRDEKKKLIAAQNALLDKQTAGEALTADESSTYAANAERLATVNKLIEDYTDLASAGHAEGPAGLGVDAVDALAPAADAQPQTSNATVRDMLEALSRSNGTQANVHVAQMRSNIEVAPGVRGFSTLGEQLVAMRKAQVTRKLDPRLSAIMERGAVTGHSESVDVDGGFLVQSDFSAAMINQIIETGVLSVRCSRFPVSGNGIKIPKAKETSRANGSRNGGIQGYWIGEGEAPTSSKMALEEQEVKLNKLGALTYATDEMLQDAPFFASWLDQKVTSELRFKLDDAIVRGSGVAMPLGILTHSEALVTQTKEDGQTSATKLNYKNIARMYARMRADRLGNAVWYINQALLPEIMFLKDDSDRNIFLPGGNIAGAPFGTLLGRPIFPIEQAEAPGTVGDIIFADLSDYMLIDKGGTPEFAASIHVKFVEGETAMKWTLRVGGAPLTSSKLTPYKGADTLSPYVVLETR